MSLDLINHIFLICVWIKTYYFYAHSSQFWKESVSQECLTVFNNLKMVSLGVLGLGEDEGECPSGRCEVTGPKTGG
jgi:hypothetical protein